MGTQATLPPAWWMCQTLPRKGPSEERPVPSQSSWVSGREQEKASWRDWGASCQGQAPEQWGSWGSSGVREGTPGSCLHSSSWPLGPHRSPWQVLGRTASHPLQTDCRWLVFLAHQTGAPGAGLCAAVPPGHTVSGNAVVSWTVQPRSKGTGAKPQHRPS